MTQNDVKYHFNRLSIAEKLIVVNLLVFLFNNLLVFLGRFKPDILVQWFELPANLLEIAYRPWSIVTYSFFHSGLGHLFWNMLMVFYTGRIFLNLFNAKRFLNVYFLGVILGGLFFVLGYNVFPVFFNSNAYLIGASAGASAILIFVCTYIPNQEVMFFMFRLKLWYIGAFVVLMDIIQLPMSNAGGHLAHLGGAFLGYLYASQLAKGTDIGAGFSKFMDGVVSFFKKSEKKSPLKTVYKNKETKSKTDSKASYDKLTRQKKIDAILDKISKSGYESLSKTEKDFLFQAGKDN